MTSSTGETEQHLESRASGSSKAHRATAEREQIPAATLGSSSPRRARRRWVAGIVAVTLLVAILAAVSSEGLFATLRNPDRLRSAIGALGYWGPVAVVLSMGLAIVISPLPSAPIALVSGAVYGHTLGTLYVAIGAEAGALAAFWLARLIGAGFAESWTPVRRLDRLKGSQGSLMAIVFVTRLLPFVSFDAVSYAAGLTPLAWWRFALATLAGILPASFLLAHFGALAASSMEAAGAILMLLGLVVIAPFLLHLIRLYRHR